MRSRWRRRSALLAALFVAGAIWTPIPVRAAAWLPVGRADVVGATVDVVSGGKAYTSYLAAPSDPEPKPAVVLLHSFNGFEPGYRELVDRFAGEGFVVLAPGWQTYERQPSDADVEQLVRDSIALLRARPDVDPSRLGLTGFCAGGRYTMLYLPTIKDFRAGVAWYGFPYSGGSGNQPTKPADLIGQLDAPMLIIHGTNDQASPIDGIYRYAEALKAAGKTYELKVYEGEPHGFMVQGGQLSTSRNAQDAYAAMIDFFNRTLRA